MERKIKLTEKELNAKINQAYLDGYNLGVTHGEQSAIFKANSIDAIRSVFGLPPLGMTMKKEVSDELS